MSNEISYGSAGISDTKEMSEGYLREPEGAPPAPENYMSENALRVLERRYLIKDDEGKVVETPSDMLHRVARNIAQAEARYGGAEDVELAERAFYGVMARLEFLPNSPTLMNAGRDLQQLSACFVLPVEDSMESIFDAVRDTALIHKSGGGTGFSFSRLRPKGHRVKTTSGVSSGPVSFMKVFDAATESVKQGGTRRGANMGILRVDHPDILEFIECKKDNKGFNNFNISVALTDVFMKAVEDGADYNLIAPHNGQAAGKLSARGVFDRIVKSAWLNGDPGIIFIDRINRGNPTPNAGEIESTNPCGEQPLLPYESCNLGSINLSAMVAQDGGIDWKNLRRVTHLAVRFLDDVIDMNRYPIEKIAEMTRANRKIGLGVMGWADMLIKLGAPYNSERAMTLADEVMRFVNTESKKASASLAGRRGAFPNFPGSIYDKPGGLRLRNATTTTIAPTGTISIIAGVSSGVEPLFALSYIRTVMDKDRLVEVHPIFEKAARSAGFYSDELMEQVAYHGHIEDIKEMPAEVRKVFVTAHGIMPEWHLRMQAAFQRNTDNAVSKTVNFSNSATIEEVAKVYTLAYHLECKGVTIYRDGSRDEQVLSTGSTYEKEKGGTAEKEKAKKVAVRPRPVTVFGSTHKVATGCGNMYVTINHDEQGRALELFTHLGKAGGCAASQTESIGRLVSLALRAGIDIEEIKGQLTGIICHQPAWDKNERIFSCADAIAKAIKAWSESVANRMKAGPLADEATPKSLKASPGGNGSGTIKAHFVAKPGADNGKAVSAGACPDCGGAMQSAEGCMTCSSCGYSKC